MKSKTSSKNLNALIKNTLAEHGAESVVCAEAGYASLFLAGGLSGRHVCALCDHLTHALKKQGLPSQIEGYESGNWIVLDAGDAVVHLMRDEVRTYYNLETLWRESA